MAKRRSPQTRRKRDMVAVVISVLVILSMAVFSFLPQPTPPDPAFPTFDPSLVTPLVTDTPAPAPTSTLQPTSVAPPAPRPPTPTATPTA